MAKVLNLDEVLQTEARTLVLGGVEYKVLELSVADYIDATKTAEKLKDSKDAGEQMHETARLVARQLSPSINVETLKALSMDRLYAIAEFVRGVDPEQIIKRAEKAAQDLAEASAKPEAEAGNEPAAEATP